MQFDLSSEGYTVDPVYMETWSGRRFDPTLIECPDIVIEDIAHALALQNRYNGHSAGPISVARHSIWVAGRVAEVTANDTQLTFIGLMHDAAEAYLGDIIRPLKHRPGLHGYLEIESYVEEIIAAAFGFDYPHPSVIKEADSYVTANFEREVRHSYEGDWRHDEQSFLHKYNQLQEKR